MVGEQVRHCSYYRCRKGNPLQGPRGGSHVLTKQETWRERAPRRAAAGWGSPGDFSATWPAFSGFMVMGLVSRLSLAKHSDSGLVSCSLFSFLITSYYRWGSPDTCIYLEAEITFYSRRKLYCWWVILNHLTTCAWRFLLFHILCFAHEHVKMKYITRHT